MAHASAKALCDPANFSLSFEFFPPKSSEGMEKLKAVALSLQAFSPDFCSVTFGAGGSTQSGTLETIKMLIAQGMSVMPHLSCVGMASDEIQALLNQYIELNISKILALRGDLPSGVGAWGDFRYACELVEFIRQTHGQQFEIAVAAYPETHPNSQNYQTDFDFFVHKVNKGADFAITQYFFNPNAFAFFVEDCQRKSLKTPIIPGILPITNFKQMLLFSERCGADVPLWLRRRLMCYEHDEASLKAFGIDVIVELTEQLLMLGATGIHFYTMNQSHAVSEIIRQSPSLSRLISGLSHGENQSQTNTDLTI